MQRPQPSPKRSQPEGFVHHDGVLLILRRPTSTCCWDGCLQIMVQPGSTRRACVASATLAPHPTRPRVLLSSTPCRVYLAPAPPELAGSHPTSWPLMQIRNECEYNQTHQGPTRLRIRGMQHTLETIMVCCSMPLRRMLLQQCAIDFNATCIGKHGSANGISMLHTALAAARCN